MAVLSVRHFAEYKAPLWALSFFFVFIVSEMASGLHSSLAWVFKITRWGWSHTVAIPNFKAARPERQLRAISSSGSFPPQRRTTTPTIPARAVTPGLKPLLETRE
jgi:hypothetical protein